MEVEKIDKFKSAEARRKSNMDSMQSIGDIGKSQNQKDSVADMHRFSSLDNLPDSKPLNKQSNEVEERMMNSHDNIGNKGISGPSDNSLKPIVSSPAAT